MYGVCPKCKKQTSERHRTTNYQGGVVVWKYHCVWCNYDYEGVSAYARDIIRRMTNKGEQYVDS